MSELWVGPLDDPDRMRLGPAVAAGAEGVLYRAYIDTPYGPLQIALKMLHPGHLGNLSEWMDRWRTQVELLVRVRVPGLVAVRGGFVGALPHPPGQADASARSLYLHMDWVEGIPLDRWIRAQPDAEPEQLLATLVPVAAALDLLHSGAATDGVAVVHRDVKPANILIRPGGDTVLVDVGTLRNTAVDTRRSGVVGTPGYIAPEVRAEAAYSPASDRYALGAVAFFLLTHDEPPPEAEIDELRRRLAQAPLLDGRLDVVDHVAAMLAPDPDARPTSAANWVAQLRRSSLAVLPGDVRIAPRAPTTRTTFAKDHLARGEWSERSRDSFLARVVAAALLLAGALSLVLFNPESSEKFPTVAPPNPTTPTTTLAQTGPEGPAGIADAGELATGDTSSRDVERAGANSPAIQYPSESLASPTITEIQPFVRCDRPPQLRFRTTTGSPSVVFFRFYIEGNEVMGAGSPMETYRNFHEVEVIQFQHRGDIIPPCQLARGTYVDWVAKATFQDGRVDEREGRLVGTGNGLSEA